MMENLLCALYFKVCNAKKKALDLITKENGEANIIAIILIIAIVVALAIIFRTQIKSLFDRIWASINSGVSPATNQYS